MSPAPWGSSRWKALMACSMACSLVQQPVTME